MTAIASRRGLDDIDIGLVVIFLMGIYSHYTIQITPTIPFPAAPSGLAGMALLWRRRSDISASAFIGFLVVVLFFLLSILSATDLSFLGRRFHGLVQIVYSLVIGFSLFLTLAQGSRDQVARLFLTLSLIILIGCLLEQYGGLRPISDAVRNKIYSTGVYEADVRDEILYGHIRPKFFASEPSAVTLCFTIFSFVWLVTSEWRWKIIAYLGLIGVGLFAISGPTLLLMLLLLAPYEMFIVGQGAGGANVARLAKIAVIGTILLGVAFLAAHGLFAKRIQEIASGSDPSFFYRVTGPALAAQKVIEHYPIAGAGLTGEPFVEDDVLNAYITSPAYSRDWTAAAPATELLINFFWLHWIYLGLVWGVVIVGALSMWLRAIGVRQFAFCWMVWGILGQASGAYVGPITWTIFFLAAAVAHLSQRSNVSSIATAPTYAARLPAVRWRALPTRLAR